MNFLNVAIHIILTPAAGISEIPAILRGEAPPLGESENIGTRDYSKKPIAVVAGGGYDDAAISQMREACAGVLSVPWLRPDITKPAPPLGPEYGKAMVARVKACLKELESEGKLAGDAVYFF